MKVKDNGQFKPLCIKALDSMPVGTEVDFDGQVVDIPSGWEQVSGKGISIKTLWENSNPTSNFDAQTIALSTADYDYYILIWSTNTSNTQYLSNFSLKGKGCYLYWGFNGTPAIAREVTYVNDATLSFASSTANGNTANGNCIPIKIIGIKEV